MSKSLSSQSFSIVTAIAWCLAWGTEATPQAPLDISTFNRWRASLEEGQLPNDPEWETAFDQAHRLTQLAKEFPPKLSKIAELDASIDTPAIGLVYGGVTKVKNYVFESADLQEIRGASALLDQINLVDLPALFRADKIPEKAETTRFSQCQELGSYCGKVRAQSFKEDSRLFDALISALIIYSTGGKLLAFCPAAFVDELCNVIEKRYTMQTLTANSCAVGTTFRPVEIYHGILQDPIEKTFWVDDVFAARDSNPLIQAYFGLGEIKSENNTPTSKEDPQQAFYNRKNFGELVGKLNQLFQQRRSGHDDVEIGSVEGSPTDGNDLKSLPRQSMRFPPAFETHPYLLRDNSDMRPAVVTLSSDEVSSEPTLSEPTARKRRVGQITKRETVAEKKDKNWFFEHFIKNSSHDIPWNPSSTQDKNTFLSWVGKFEQFLNKSGQVADYDPSGEIFEKDGRLKEGAEATREARSLTEIGAASRGYVAYIYADGNSMGEYIRNEITTPEQYQTFSQDIFEATEQSVYHAIAECLAPFYYEPTAKSPRQPGKTPKAPVWIHPFEIVTIGGDDVLLVVPANKALEVANTIGGKFDELLVDKGYTLNDEGPKAAQALAHRFRPKSETAPLSDCCLSISSGVLITAVNTPIYYADKLVTQLLKSAKQHRNQLKKNYHYQGGTVDFLVLKAVTMLSSKISEFREEGLTFEPPNRKHKLKLYAAPYTLYELDGLIKTVRAFKKSKFPKSQLYQIRSLLERGKRTAILNYRYFRVRLDSDTKRSLLEKDFEQAWCQAGTNGGNLAPWLTAQRDLDSAMPENDSLTPEKTTYATIWREIVDLEPFIEEASSHSPLGDESSTNQLEGNEA